MTATNKQISMLVHFMEEHPDIAKNYVPRTTQGRAETAKFWSDLAGKLNGTGLPAKTAVAWRKYQDRCKCNSNTKVFGAPPQNPMWVEDEVEQVELKKEEEEENETEENAGSCLIEAPWEFAGSPVPVEEKVYPAREVTFEHVKRKSTAFGKISKPRRVKRPVAIDDKTLLLEKQMKYDAKFQNNLLSLLKERNKQNVAFQEGILKLLEKRNDIAAKQNEQSTFDSN